MLEVGAIIIELVMKNPSENVKNIRTQNKVIVGIK